MTRVGEHQLEPVHHATARDLRRPRWRCHECGLELPVRGMYLDPEYRVCDWRKQRAKVLAAYVKESGGKLPVALARSET